MSGSKHTPGELFVNTANEQIGDVWSKDFDRPFAQIQQTGPRNEDLKQVERRENAAELVKRWNLHPQLLEDFKSIKNECPGGEFHCIDEAMAALSRIEDICNKAIALATGKEPS